MLRKSSAKLILIYCFTNTYTANRQVQAKSKFNKLNNFLKDILFKKNDS